MRTLSLGLIAASSLLFACNGLDYADPTGQIAGQVTDGTTAEPVAEVAVSLWTANQVIETVSDADGVFRIEGVPSGSELWLDLAKEGYASQRHLVTIDDSAGEQPQSNSLSLLEAEMFPNNNTVMVTVLDSLGTPLPNVTLIASGMRGTPVRLLGQLTATTGRNGTAVFQNIAARQTYQIVARPFTKEGEILTGEVSYTQRLDGDEIELVVF